MGGAEASLYSGPVWYTPIVEEWYYQVEVLKLEVGEQNLELDCREVSVQLRLVRCRTGSAAAALAPPPPVQQGQGHR